ncbi:hypothetical protein L208DRAFT_1550665 [Tricholoma matsutake]|nr:hypothetical protein L208DRAFT_1550665 [Tricholoma matsutake 945]
MLDLYVAFNERLISESSQDLMTFQTPFSALQIVTLPMGWMNLVLILHDDITFILQPKVPHITIPYIDDTPHFENLNCIVQCMKYCGGTFSGLRLFACVPEIIILGH